jgi:acetyl-CoA C-acetyltransferase
MPLDPRTPVLVGVAAVTQRTDDPIEASEPLDLMEEALRRAAEDAGSKALLERVDSIWSPRGFWAYSDPGKILAERFGAGAIRTVVAEIGILQTSVLGRAAQAIARGESEIAMIVGAEARDRASRLGRQGLDVPLTEQTRSEPDEVMSPHAEIMGQFEIELGLITPIIQYSMIDNAIRFHERQSMAEHRAELGALWGGFNRVAVENPDAWNRAPMSPEEIVTGTDENRMLSYPYTKSLVSQWNVNQAGGLILCSLEAARSLNLDESRFIYPLAVVDSEHMVTLSERRDLWRSPGFELAGKRIFEYLGRGAEEIDHFELYSCFPAAVRVQQREFGLPLDRRVTQTGGMTFGGGPLNNFVIQAWVKMVECMRADPGSRGLVTAISGLITKQGVSAFGSEPEVPFVHENVTEATEKAWRTIDVDRRAQGRATISSYTVSHNKNAANGVVIVADFGETRRTLRVVEDPEMMATGEREELCGREVELLADGGVRWL